MSRVRKLEEEFHVHKESAKSYDRLGGVYSIATVVDDFIDLSMADPRLN